MRTIMVTDGNLFQVAAEYLGDPTQWTRIATLNGLQDPMIDGMAQLRIPDMSDDRGHLSGT